MVKLLFQRVGIDYVQWAALTKALLKKDFRESSMSAGLSHGRSGGRVFFSLLLFYLLTGLIFVPIVFQNPDVFLTATLLITYTMFMIGGLILVEYNTVVISPDDYPVLGYRPISSRTFFFVKLCNILFYVLLFSTVLSLPAILAYFFKFGFTLGLTAFISIFLANFTAALVVVLFYTFVLKKVSLRRLQNIFALLQVGLAFTIYSSFFIIPKLVESALFQSFDISKSPFLMFLPSTWFSTYLKIPLGKANLFDWLVVLGSISIMAILAYLAFAKLSLGYSERLAELAGRSVQRVGKKKLKWSLLGLKLTNEEHVVSVLIRNQFLYDNKFKMAVLSILPLTIFYLFYGTQTGPLPNPFETQDFEMGRTGLLYLLIFLFPMMLRTFVTQSDAYQASWMFYTAPTDFQRLIISEKNFLMIYFVLPFLVILGLIFYHYFENLLHVLQHILVLGLLAHLFLQFAFLFSPDLPFSRPNVKGGRSRNMALLLIIVPFILYLILPLIFRVVYPSPASFLTFTITILTSSLILESLIKVRVSYYMKSFEFTG